MGDRSTKVMKLVKFHLSSTAPNGSEVIDQFVTSAYAHYKELRRTKTDNARHLYVPVPGDKDSGDRLLFRRYRLSDEKAFDSFYHPDKVGLLRLIESFTKKSGKFAVPGYPNKLGLLLHGPPGTGKTSFIKVRLGMPGFRVTLPFIPSL